MTQPHRQPALAYRMRHQATAARFEPGARWRMLGRHTALHRHGAGAMLRVAAVALALATPASAQSDIDPDHRYAWAENIGWTNWRDAESADAGADVAITFLSGFVWAENVGWINLGDGTPADGVHYANDTGADAGVNVDPETGDLSGLAWGENIGWINFDTASAGDQRARYDVCQRRFFGFVWGENVGWINLGNSAEHYVAVGPCDLSDADCDGDVDLDDYGAFQIQFSGADVAHSCPTFDSDGDDDLDFIDWGALQIAFSPTE